MSDSTILGTGFAHRVNEDGTFDTICRKCFMTVATRTIEADLKTQENEHDCAALPDKISTQFLKRDS